MIRAEIELLRPVEDAWWHLLDTESWKEWWGGNLKEVRPRWENGAEMVWEMGRPSTVLGLTECESLEIQDEWMLSTIGLIGRRPGSTLIEILESPTGGASFADGGAGRVKELSEKLARFKTLVEAEPRFLHSLSEAERKAVGNLPPMEYLPVINEKSGGSPIMILTPDGPAAEEALAERTRILRRLSVTEIRRLMGSVQAMMEGDRIARSGSPDSFVNAAGSYRRAAAFNPCSALALMSYGVVLARAGQKEAGLVWLERALEVDPADERTLKNLAAVRADFGKKGAAPVAGATGAPHCAGFWLRAGAALIDGLLFGVVSIVFLVAGEAVYQASGGSALAGLSLTLVPVSLGWLYFALMESSKRGATVGKLLFHLCVTDLAGRRISFARATGRYFSKFLSALTFYVGFVMAAFTARKQALHDLLVGTLVVKRPEVPSGEHAE